MASGIAPAEEPIPGVEAEPEPVAEATAVDIEHARIDLRTAAYCVLCDALVERQPDGTCPDGHPAQALTGRILLDADEPVPSLPGFNLAAFLIPPIWGPGHGIWIGAIFLPIWLFADSIMISALRFGGRGQMIGAAVVLLATVAFEYFFARRANGVAFRRVIHKMTAEEFVRRQRIWAFVAIPIAAALLGWGLYFDLVLSATLKR